MIYACENFYFYVWHPDGGEDGPIDGRLIRSRNHQAAAEHWAKNYDCDDHSLSSDEDRREIVKVQMLANDAPVHTFSVRCVISRDYCAESQQ